MKAAKNNPMQFYRSAFFFAFSRFFFHSGMTLSSFVVVTYFVVYIAVIKTIWMDFKMVGKRISVYFSAFSFISACVCVSPCP